MNMKNVTHTFVSCFKLPSFLLSVSLLAGYTLSAQSVVYDNFEGAKSVRYTEKGGVLDTLVKNPAPNDINKSAKCALYVRNGSKKFDNIKMGMTGNLSEVEKYATYLGIPPRFKLKVYTSAPAGTLVEILLGSRKGNNDYPAGTHSQYQAYTKKSNEWEELEFLFSQIPQGSETSASQIDQVVLLFNPNSATSDSYYFDDLTGPPIATGATGSVNMSGATDNASSVNTAEPVATPASTNTSTDSKPKKSKKNKK